MITNIGLLVEELSVLICIHYLYDKKIGRASCRERV